MCESLKVLVHEELLPMVKEAVSFAGADRKESLEALVATFEEILEDIDKRSMDAWECGELYEEFTRYMAEGDFLDKIS